MAREFLSLDQTIKTIIEITFRFTEKALIFPNAANCEIKMARYSNMLRNNIYEFISVAQCKTLE